MKLVIGSDHAGLELKRQLLELLAARGMAYQDVGTHDGASVDYPDFAAEVARRVSAGECSLGVLVCGTGIGMSIAANRQRGVRAALCTSEFEARMARAHNDANVLCLGQRVVGPGLAWSILEAFLEQPFEGGRHARRVQKIDQVEDVTMENTRRLADVDPEIYRAIQQETRRQEECLELIASENFVSPAVLEALGSTLTNKYAEGYPGKRYYGGCEVVDVAESLAIERAKALFGAEHVNVQPHSGSQANMGAYMTFMKPGETMLALDLNSGGHLTHGSAVNFSGKLYKVVHYGLERDTETIDFAQVQALAREHRPKVIVVGASAYPRTLEFDKFREIADAAGAAMVVDIAHIAGLVAAGCHPSPVPLAEIVTTTTHKTLRGPRGGMVMCKDAYARTLNSQIFPGIQGGPLMHVIAAKAVALKEAQSPAFRDYQQQIVKNARALAEALKRGGLRLCSGGTDNNLMLVDLRPKRITGKVAEAVLEKAGITVNKNMIPFDPEKPMVTSGVRVGTPAVTTRGMGEKEMDVIGAMVCEALDHGTDEAHLASIRGRVKELTRQFPLYASRLAGA